MKELSGRTRLFISRKVSRAIGFVLLCFVFFCLPFPIKAMEVNQEITVSAVLGYDGYGKFGRMTPGFIEVSANIDFEGIVKVIVPLQNGEKNYAYEYPIFVEAGKKEKVWVNFPLTANYTVFSVEVIGQDGQIYAMCEPYITIPSSQLTELYVGVVSEQKNAYLAFQAQKIGEDKVSNFPYVTTRAFDLTVEEIAVLPDGMDTLDFIIFDSVSYAKLSSQQKIALDNWADEGGILVLEITEDTPWLEVTENVSVPVETRPIFWTQTKQLQKGLKCYVWIDSDQIDMMEYMIENTELASAMLGQFCSVEYVTDLVERDHYYEGSQTYEQIKEVLESSVLKQMPNILIYLIILIFYLSLAGPVLYLYLKKHDKTHLTGRGLLILSISFSLFIYLISYPTRFKKPFVQYVSICSIQEDQMKEEISFALRAPFHKAYYMGIDSSYQVNPITGGTYYYYDDVDSETVIKEYQAGIFYYGDYTAVTVEKSAPFSAQYFTVEKYQQIDKEKSFLCDLTFLTDTVSGTVTNQFDRPFSNVVLLIKDGVVLLGDLEAGETVHLEDKTKIVYSSGSEKKAAYQILGLSYTDSIQTASQEMLEKVRALEYYLKCTHIDLESGILVGFCEDYQPQWQKESNYQMSGVTMMTEKIDFHRTERLEENQDISLEEANFIGNSMEEVKISYFDTIISLEGPSLEGRQDFINMEKEVASPDERTGMIYEYVINGKEDLVGLTFLSSDESILYDGEIILFNRITMEQYQVQTMEGTILIEDIKKCFYEKNGVTNLAVLYLPSDSENSDYPVLRLRREILLEYTFLDEKNISVSNEAEYNAEQNSTSSTSVQLKYNVGSKENLYQIIFVDAQVSQESVQYQTFSGNRYFLNTETFAFERIDEQEKIFSKEALQSYLDVNMEGNYLTVQYISGTLNYGTEKQICLPRICVVRKK